MVRILLLCMVVCVFLVDVVKSDEKLPDTSADDLSSWGQAVNSE